jgi:superfamily II DNA helicase RecQ
MVDLPERVAPAGAAEDDRPRERIGRRVAAQPVVQRNDVQHVQQLALVLVEAFHLDVEQAHGVELDAGSQPDQGRQRDLVALLDRAPLAAERGVPPYLIFSDASLREMARLRPTSEAAFLQVKGVGEWKREAFGERFLDLLRKHR